MNATAARRDLIRNAWKTVADSGIPIYPMRASVQAMENLGCDMAPAQPLLSDGEALFRADRLDDLLVVMAKINTLTIEQLAKVRRDEPGTWEAYRKDLPAAPPLAPSQIPIDSRIYEDRILGAWLGKCAGTALGEPVEGWSRDQILREHRQIRSYVGVPNLVNDDTAYAPLLLHVLDERGVGWTSRDLALEWLCHLPFAYTAAQAALDNIAAGVMPPESRWFRNPCGAWVGAQMRGEIHGLVAPGSPRIAAEFAFRDASISHYREGVDGEIYVAAVTSLVVAGLPVEDALVAGLEHLPGASPLIAVVEATIDCCRRSSDEALVAKWIEQTFGRYHWIHCIPSLACAVAGLILGEGDFEQSLLRTLHLGFDTDCTAGLVGALVGGSLGASSLPQKWIEPLGDVLPTYVIGFETLPFNDLVHWTSKWGRVIAPSACSPGPTRL
ncbi:ADP-ribosylglycohydrolase family protein [Candidatus Bipolaricaulota bacterium]|nr:ADP-ribosylglycohydrolase family protein [Candidatus Bipolaricaulota bacterium]